MSVPYLGQTHKLELLLLSEIIVITLESAKAEICALPKKYDLDLVLDVVTIPTTSISASSSSHGCETMDLGTADAIRLIHDKLKAKRIMIVSSDLITDVQVTTVVIILEFTIGINILIGGEARC